MPTASSMAHDLQGIGAWATQHDTALSIRVPACHKPKIPRKSKVAGTINAVGDTPSIAAGVD